MYHLNEIYLLKFDCEKILGVYISNQLSFCQLVYYVIDKARKMCNLILRSFANCEPKVVVDIYKVCIRPIIDY